MSARVTWLGHATVLIELGPLGVLDRPAAARAASRTCGGTPAPADVPERLDAVLVSHLHRDHADGPSLRLLPPAPVLAPAAPAACCASSSGREVVELREGDTVPLRDGTVTAVPAVHDGRRSPLHPQVARARVRGGARPADLLRGRHGHLRRHGRRRAARRRARAHLGLGHLASGPAISTARRRAGRGAARAPHRGADPLGDLPAGRRRARPPRPCAIPAPPSRATWPSSRYRTARYG